MMLTDMILGYAADDHDDTHGHGDVIAICFAKSELQMYLSADESIVNVPLQVSVPIPRFTVGDAHDS